jgi:hypothetical protein
MNNIYEKERYAKKLIAEFEKGKFRQFVWDCATTYIQTKYGLLIVYLGEGNPLDYFSFSYKWVYVNTLKE